MCPSTRNIDYIFIPVDDHFRTASPTHSLCSSCTLIGADSSICNKYKKEQAQENNLHIITSCSGYLKETRTSDSPGSEE